ncbi:sortase, partial [Candidatus Saccharibacteria bacterium]|nr:sortase [Candidatus Saccharibacteria bacterium]
DGDLIYLNYNSVRYTYSVNKKETVEPTDVAALTGAVEKPTLILVTCTPLGTSRYRLLVFAEQVSPAATTEKTGSESSGGNVVDSGSTAMPSNEPGFFESIWNWLTGQ